MAKNGSPRLFQVRRAMPKDELLYLIPSSAIAHTEKVLLDYANLHISNEGMVYWGGIREGNIVRVEAVIAPTTTSHPGSVTTSHRSNFDFVKALTDNNHTYIGQVHSHPGTWVDHSDGDSEWAAYKFEGLLSIVVPIYGRRGMLPLTKCGAHRFQSGTFVRLSSTYVANHFQVLDECNVHFVDLRNE